MIDYAQAAKDSGAKILFCEPDERIIHAAHELKKQGLNPVLVGEATDYEQATSNPEHLDEIPTIPIDPERYAKQYHELRKHKNISEADARNALQDPAFYSCMLLADGQADGLVCGASWPTENTLRPALQILAQGLASSFFIMQTARGEHFFTDCAMNIQPAPDQLAQIAINTAQQAQKLGVQPRIAMLSFSTVGSAHHPEQEKVMQATQAVKKHRDEHQEDWKVSGEYQVDAALDEQTAQRKAAGKEVRGDANILVFPDLDAGNIGYKLVQQYTGCEAIGPIITGLKKPVNDLSRGCDAQEIIQVAQITAWQSLN